MGVKLYMYYVYICGFSTASCSKHQSQTVRPLCLVKYWETRLDNIWPLSTEFLYILSVYKVNKPRSHWPWLAEPWYDAVISSHWLWDLWLADFTTIQTTFESKVVPNQLPQWAIWLGQTLLREVGFFSLFFFFSRLQLKVSPSKFLLFSSWFLIVRQYGWLNDHIRKKH